MKMPKGLNNDFCKYDFEDWVKATILFWLKRNDDSNLVDKSEAYIDNLVDNKFEGLSAFELTVYLGKYLKRTKKNAKRR